MSFPHSGCIPAHLQAMGDPEDDDEEEEEKKRSGDGDEEDNDGEEKEAPWQVAVPSSKDEG